MKVKKFIVVQIRILSGTTVDEILPGRCQPEDHILFLISNEDPAQTKKYKVTIDPGLIFQKQFQGMGMPPKDNPFDTNPARSVTLDPGEADIIRFKIHKANKFGTGGGLLPYTTYKYSLDLTDPVLAVTTTIDPDLDVTP